ncbi:hypothetical protein N657DRAFT_685551 [Parathielavia appendiculata]|uniref:Uncharacterized protein n=1 Tax=Parathielavia appendiculata TaxID=2587402 RepID=A0AAN6YXR4_9PEZI|nr:hypothetical protein N657DRAFT_685551 [Parathielavia appendiculata]
MHVSPDKAYVPVDINARPRLDPRSRQSRAVIKKYGTRAINWLKCVGAWSQILDCSFRLINCSTYGSAP